MVKLVSCNFKIADKLWNDFLLCWDDMEDCKILELNEMRISDFWNDYILEKTDLDFVRVCLVEKERILDDELTTKHAMVAKQVRHLSPLYGSLFV